MNWEGVNAANLRHMLRGVRVVGIARPSQCSAALAQLHLQLLQVLLRDVGFRTLAAELDWSDGMRIDACLAGESGRSRHSLPHSGELGEGGLPEDEAFGVRGVAGQLPTPWQSEDFIAVLRWMQTFNAVRTFQQLRFIGLDIARIDVPVYEAVVAHVARVAPERKAPLRELYATLRPRVDIDRHVEWYRKRTDKQAFIDAARKAYALVASLAPDDDHAMALQHAGCIVAFHECESLEDTAAQRACRDQAIAKNVAFWHASTGDKIVCWHTEFEAGDLLREQYGPGYAALDLADGGIRFAAAPDNRSSCASQTQRMG